MRFIFLLLLLDLFDHLVLRFAVRFSFSLSFDYSLCKKWLSFIFSALCFVFFFFLFFLLRGLLSRAVVLGFRVRLNSRLHIKISSLLWWHLSHGVLSGS